MDFDADDIPELIPTEEPEENQRSFNDKVSVVKRVPLTIICGFLGAGKSTLLRRILTERHGYRIAVIMNEFGDTADIEAKSITVDGESTTLELANGCLCCSIKDAGAAAIEKLMQKQGGFDHILLETTGLADPGPIAGMFWHNEEYVDAQSVGHEYGIMLDGVVCVVDAVFGLKQMEEDHSDAGGDGPGESLRQIAGSDVIILNKVDLVDSSILAATETAIKYVNPAAPIYRTTQAELDISRILGLQAYSTGRQHLSGFHDQTSPHDHDHDHDHNHDHEQGHASSTVPHYVTRGISSLQVSLPPLSDNQFAAFDVWIRTILWENRLAEVIDGVTSTSDSTVQAQSKTSINVLRCKGLLILTSGKRHVLQGVRSMYEIIPVDDDDEAMKTEFPHVGKVVLIGKGLGEDVRRSLIANVMG
ncbi:CobW domain-containing protein [Lentinula raphanica]|uniref:CobW domain-containing protein n=1 Tax=Lentinula raphanica TaxID=153919 RepID=A0AA38PKS5_9AGAR|nr:CobW domain-containing protein [Lentinula raphanica]KAJ3844541.1 CobW domain-containing protein [Lentinula raphanica]KAJ3972015.1 CobW domain-containing protein [Lentinula raphanica]